ncbi:MAG: FAD-dependent oxidoreductase [Solirubrobacteraceae bacterium]
MLIAGGGLAALEAMLALRALADSVHITTISSSRALAYRPAATGEAFIGDPALEYDLKALTEEAGVSWRLDRLEAVAPAQRRVRLASFAFLDYDELVLAVGARRVIGIPGALTFRDQRDIHHVRRTANDLGAGRIGRVVFAVPCGSSWPLPLYELAMFTAAELRRGPCDESVAIVSPESTPLEAFGERASALVAEVLADSGVRFLGGVEPWSVQRDGSLGLRSGAPIKADRVIAAPALRGPRITGVPSGPRGFIPTDGFGRVSGLEHVYAAGDMTNYPIKQGGLAAQQADAIAQGIAGRYGASVSAHGSGHVLCARLACGPTAMVLQTDLDDLGRPTGSTLQYGCPPDALPDLPLPRFFGRHLTPFLNDRAPGPAAERAGAP